MSVCLYILSVYLNTLPLFILHLHEHCACVSVLLHTMHIVCTSVFCVYMCMCVYTVPVCLYIMSPFLSV